MVSKVSISETAPQLPTSVLKTPVWLNDSYIHEELKIGLHMLPDSMDHQSFYDNTAPSPSLLVSVSKRNGFMTTAKASTGASG